MYRRTFNVLRGSLLVGVSVLLLVSASAASALEPGAKPPEIGLKDFTGKPVTLASLKGKVVLVDFWATWCAPCKEELPVLQKLYAKYRSKGFVVVAVSVDKDGDKARKFAKKLGLTFPVVHDGGHKVSGSYKPPKMPSSYVIDRKGLIRHVHAGYRSEDAAKFEKEIKALL